MTTALYRRYRPETFQEVIGQEHVTEPLMAALRGERITHAYLFSGPRGCGKTTSARILARCLNCVDHPTDTPCGTCPSCRDLARGGPGSLDVVEIDAASHGGVEDARDLRERATFAPARDRFKVFIIDEAHMVSPQGFNALLKLVEEPPEHVKFIFATTEPEKVIGTIRSRTHHYPFRLVPPETLEGYLEALCREEGVAVGGGVLPMVVRAGGGSVRDSLSVLDQLVAGAIDGEVDYVRAAALLGFTDATLLDDVTDAIGARDGAAVFAAVDRVVQTGHDPRRFVEDLLQRLRDLVVLGMAGDAGAQALGSVPADHLERLRGQAEHIGVRRLSAVADLTNAALSEMSGATSPRLQLELLCARILLVGDAPQQSAVGRDAAPEPQRPATPPRLRVADSRVRPQPEAAPGGASAPSAAPVRREDAEPARGTAAPPRREDPEPTPGVPASSSEVAGDTVRTRSAAEGSAPVPDREARDGATQDGASEPTPAEHGTAGVPAEPTREGTAPAPTADPGDARMIHQRWDEVVGAVGSVVPRSLLKQDARPGELAGGALRVDFTNPALVGHFSSRGGEEELARALFETLGLRVRVHAAVGGDSAPAPAAMGGWQAGAEPSGPGRDGDREVRPAAGRGPGGRESASRPSAREPRPARTEAAEDDAPGHEPGPLTTSRSAGAQESTPQDPVPQGRAPESRTPEASTTGPASEPDDGGWPEVAVPGAGWSGTTADDHEPTQDVPVPSGVAEPEGPADAAAGDLDDADERSLAQAVDTEVEGLVAPADDPSTEAPTPGVPLGDLEARRQENPGTGATGESPAADVGTTGRPAEAPARDVGDLPVVPPPTPEPAVPEPAAVREAPERAESPFAALAQAPVVPPPAPSPRAGAKDAATGAAPTVTHPWERHLPAQARAALERRGTAGGGGGDAFAGGWEPPPEPVDDISFDDADADASTEVGLPVLQELLGAVVLEEIDTTQTDQKGW